MNAPTNTCQPSLYGDEPDVDNAAIPPDFFEPGPPQPLNWNLLTADEAEFQWYDLDDWITWLRQSFGLPPTVVPPFWHRHDELVWELSALHQYWLYSYDPDGTPAGPIAWLRDFSDAQARLRVWVSTCGTKLDRDRPTRQSVWPGEPAAVVALEVQIQDRDADFRQFVRDDIAARRRIEQQVRDAA